MSDHPQQAALTIADALGRPKPIAPLHNAAVDLAVLKGEASDLKTRIDAKKSEILAIMDEHNVTEYSNKGVTIHIEDKVVVKVVAGAGRFVDGTLTDEEGNPIKDEPPPVPPDDGDGTVH